MYEKGFKKPFKEIRSRLRISFVAIARECIGNHIRKQLLRSSTSTVAYYRAASVGQTKKCFIAKLSIAIGECDESLFWIEFLADENLLQPKGYEAVYKEAK